MMPVGTVRRVYTDPKYITKEELEKLCVDNLWIAKSVAKKFHYKCKLFSVEMEDVVATAMESLVKVLYDYNPELGYSLSTFAYPRIWGDCQKAFFDKRNNDFNLHKISLEGKYDSVSEDGANQECLNLVDKYLLGVEETMETTLLRKEIFKQELSRYKESDLEILSLYSEGVSQPKISKILNISQATVSRRLKFLKEDLEYLLMEA